MLPYPQLAQLVLCVAVKYMASGSDNEFVSCACMEIFFSSLVVRNNDSIYQNKFFTYIRVNEEASSFLASNSGLPPQILSCSCGFSLHSSEIKSG